MSRRNRPLELYIKRKKTEEQKRARQELFILTDEEINPGWFNNPEMVKRRDELLKIIEPKPTEEDIIRDYFSLRPYLEKKIVQMLRAGWSNTAIFEACEVYLGAKKINYLRKKHNILRKQTRTEKN